MFSEHTFHSPITVLWSCYFIRLNFPFHFPNNSHSALKVQLQGQLFYPSFTDFLGDLIAPFAIVLLCLPFNLAPYPESVYFMVCLSSFIDYELPAGRDQVLFFLASPSMSNMFSKWVSRIYYGCVRGLDDISSIPQREDSSDKGK